MVALRTPCLPVFVMHQGEPGSLRDIDNLTISDRVPTDEGGFVTTHHASRGVTRSQPAGEPRKTEPVPPPKTATNDRTQWRPHNGLEPRVDILTRDNRVGCFTRAAMRGVLRERHFGAAHHVEIETKNQRPGRIPR